MYGNKFLLILVNFILYSFKATFSKQLKWSLRIQSCEQNVHFRNEKNCKVETSQPRMQPGLVFQEIKLDLFCSQFSFRLYWHFPKFFFTKHETEDDKN